MSNSFWPILTRGRYRIGLCYPKVGQIDPTHLARDPNKLRSACFSSIDTNDGSIYEYIILFYFFFYLSFRFCPIEFY